jgi:hypothetical protein
LCCVALPFTASADFAIDKEAGQPCQHLRADFRCGIHALLRDRGFPGCAAFDCFGAGQQVSQVTFRGRDWREAPHTAAQMFAVFPIMRRLHELLWYLTEALRMPPARPSHHKLRHALIRAERLTRSSPDALADIDMATLRASVDPLLEEASQLVRATVPRQKAKARTSGTPTSAAPTSQTPCSSPSPRSTPQRETPRPGWLRRSLTRCTGSVSRLGRQSLELV